MEKISRMTVALGLAVIVSLSHGCASLRPLALDLDGKARDPLAGTNAATVFIFIGNDCPIANRYAPEFGRLRETFEPRGVSFWLVHADASESAAAIREHARAYSLTMPELRDPEHRLVELCHTEVTPSVAVFNREKELVYRGRIDDRAADVGRERARAAHHDLADALDAVLAGRPVATPVTEAIGCNIPMRH